jgi:CBS domain-containing protein
MTAATPAADNSWKAPCRLADLPCGLGRTVLMTTEVLTISAERSVAEVTGMMVKTRVGSAVVMEGSWLAGILTERDVLRAAASGSDITKAPISQWMTRNPITANSDTTVGEAADMMLTNGFATFLWWRAANSRAW